MRVANTVELKNKTNKILRDVTKGSHPEMTRVLAISFHLFLQVRSSKYPDLYREFLKSRSIKNIFFLVIWNLNGYKYLKERGWSQNIRIG
jgi:hypothetical protein